MSKQFRGCSNLSTQFRGYPQLSKQFQEYPQQQPNIKGKGSKSALAQIKRLQETARKPTAPPNNISIVLRTWAVQAALKQLQIAAKEVANKNSQGRARNTGSKSYNTLERAIHVACYFDNKNGDVQQLASWRYSAAIFLAALVVMNIELGDSMKHIQLTNHQDSDINRAWNTPTANRLGRVFQGVGD